MLSARSCRRVQQILLSRRIIRQNDLLFCRGASTLRTEELPEGGLSKKLRLELPHHSKPLGSPLPFDEHACSVSLPTWSSVVGYEEGDPSVTSAMRCGYPRFVYHPYVLQLMNVVLDKYGNGKEDCLVLPTKQAALRCQAFLQQSLEKAKTTDNAMIERPEGQGATNVSDTSNSRIRTVTFPEVNVHAVLFPAETMAGMAAKAYWQHTGELVSSRRAEQVLKILGQDVNKRVTCGPVDGSVPSILHSCDEHVCNSSTQQHDKNSFEQLKQRIVDWTGVPMDFVFLTPSGMSTIYKALKSSRRYQMQKDPLSKGGTSIVFGFPYLDTLKLCSRTEFCPDGVEFFGKGDESDLNLLERLLQQRTSSRWSALVTEIPSNPLLQCPDLEKIEGAGG